MENYKDYYIPLDKQRKKLNNQFFSGEALYNAIKEG